ncbi:MAG: adenylate/guanylate cyclase domain-containing protein, partial [Deltaproteobacteria bacterium]|nr:adenylate/guanylate cyclase domain-containing protein [Deltaproteobacteria bacterium]
GREMDLIRVMGISTPVRIYEILSKKGELSESVAQGVSHFEKGLELYRAQQWDKAIAQFNEVMKFIPNDPPSKTFIQRCQDYKAAPPPADWDGVFVASSK